MRRLDCLAALAGTVLVILFTGCNGSGPAEKPSPSELIAKAYPLFAEAAGRSWPPPGQRMMQVHQAMGSGAMKRALKILEAELAANPDNLEATFYQGMIHYMRSQLGAARPRFEKILESGPSFAGSEKVFYFYGSCLMRLGQGGPARDSLLTQLKLDPGDGETCYSLGLLDLEEGYPDKALARFEQALVAFRSRARQGGGMAEQRARAFAGMGNAHFQKDELEKAESALRKSINLDPRQSQVFYTLSRVLLRGGDKDGAMRAMEEFQRLKAGPGRGPGARQK